jgi:glycerol kinase
VAWDVPGEATAWAIEGGVFTASTAVEWLVSLGLAPDGPGVTALATRAGDDVPLFLPSFSGVGAPWWRPGAAGVLSGLRASTTPADIARAVLTGIAQRVADVLDAVEAEQGLAAAIRVDGGLSASEVLLQLQADLAGRPVLPSAERETTAAGVAALAAIGCGALTLEDLGARARFAAPVEPRLAPAAREAARERWRAFVDATAALDPA